MENYKHIKISDATDIRIEYANAEFQITTCRDDDQTRVYLDFQKAYELAEFIMKFIPDEYKTK